MRCMPAAMLRLTLLAVLDTKLPVVDISLLPCSLATLRELCTGTCRRQRKPGIECGHHHTRAGQCWQVWHRPPVGVSHTECEVHPCS
jgi:hypothetical protein